MAEAGIGLGGLATLGRGWRYAEATGRDARLDLLRGAFVVAMLVDHLGGTSWLHPLTGGNHFFVSAAEGFVLLSGLVMGLVYMRLIDREGLWAATGRAWRRAALLYGWAVVLAVASVGLAGMIGASWGRPVADLPAVALGVASLREGVYLADVLMLYALLVLAAPVALLLLVRRRTGWLLAGSGGLWAAYQVGWTAPLDGLFAGLAWFPPLAWQFVFVLGLALGAHWRGLGAKVARRHWEVGLVGLALAAAGLIALAIWAPDGPLAEPVAAFFAKEPLRPGRLLAAAIFFPLLFGLATLLWRPLRVGLGWLVPLGRSSLLAYTLHLFLAAAANAWLADVPGYALNDAATNTVAHLAALWVLVGLVRALPAAAAFGGGQLGAAWAWLVVPRPSHSARWASVAGSVVLVASGLLSTGAVTGTGSSSGGPVAAYATAGPAAVRSLDALDWSPVGELAVLAALPALPALGELPALDAPAPVLAAGGMVVGPPAPARPLRRFHSRRSTLRCLDSPPCER